MAKKPTRVQEQLGPVEQPALPVRERTQLLQERLNAVAPELQATFRRNVSALAKSGRLAPARPVRKSTLELSEALLGVDQPLTEAAHLEAWVQSMWKPTAPGGSQTQALTLASPNSHELRRLESELARFETFIPRKAKS